MKEDSDQNRPIIICPLRRELRLLQRAAPRDADVEWLCCGPGQRGVEVAAKAIGASRRTVILAGLAGGLSERVATGSAVIVAEVVDADTGKRWTPTWPAARSGFATGVKRVATSSRASVLTPQSKADLYTRTAADLVDLESVAFAEAAEAAGWTWGIIRGVSDGLHETLPNGIDEWVDRDGRARIGYLLRAVTRHPGLVRDIFRLAASSKMAVSSIGSLVFGDQIAIQKKPRG